MKKIRIEKVPLSNDPAGVRVQLVGLEMFVNERTQSYPGLFGVPYAVIATALEMAGKHRLVGYFARLPEVSFYFQKEHCRLL